MQTITLAEVKAAALKAYKQRSLLAQKPMFDDDGVIKYGYRVGDCVCAIGAALTPETLALVNENDLAEIGISDVHSFANVFDWDGDEHPKLQAIQDAHDAWLGAVDPQDRDVTSADRERIFYDLITID